MKNKIQVIISFILILSGALLGFFYIEKNYRHNKDQNQKLEEFFDDYNEVDISSEIGEENIIDKPIKEVNYDNYIAVIEIPYLNLKEGMIISNNMNVINNVAIYKGYDVPDKENGKVIIYAHSGNSRVAYFRNIYKLRMGDEIIIYYNKKKYTYEVINNYEINKNQLSINNINEPTITLITCKKDDNTKRVGYCWKIKFVEI